jgi:hypothetical protein
MAKELFVDLVDEVKEDLEDAMIQHFTFPSTLNAIRLFDVLERQEKLDDIFNSITVDLNPKLKTKSALRNKR